MLIICSGTGTGGCSWAASSVTTLEEHIAKSDGYIVATYAVLSSGGLVFCCKGNSLTIEVFRSHSIRFGLSALSRGCRVGVGS